LLRERWITHQKHAIPDKHAITSAPAMACHGSVRACFPWHGTSQFAVQLPWFVLLVVADGDGDATVPSPAFSPPPSSLMLFLSPTAELVLFLLAVTAAPLDFSLQKLHGSAHLHPLLEVLVPFAVRHEELVFCSHRAALTWSCWYG
jgi:hypothetical protein